MSSDRSINVRTLLCGKEGLFLSSLGTPNLGIGIRGSRDAARLYENLMKIIVPGMWIRGDWKELQGGNWFRKCKMLRSSVAMDLILL